MGAEKNQNLGRSVVWGKSPGDFQNQTRNKGKEAQLLNEEIYFFIKKKVTSLEF